MDIGSLHVSRSRGIHPTQGVSNRWISHKWRHLKQFLPQLPRLALKTADWITIGQSHIRRQQERVNNAFSSYKNLYRERLICPTPLFTILLDSIAQNNFPQLRKQKLFKLSLPIQVNHTIANSEYTALSIYERICSLRLDTTPVQ